MSEIVAKIVINKEQLQGLLSKEAVQTELNIEKIRRGARKEAIDEFVKRYEQLDCSKCAVGKTKSCSEIDCINKIAKEMNNGEEA